MRDDVVADRMMVFVFVYFLLFWGIDDWIGLLRVSLIGAAA